MRTVDLDVIIPLYKPDKKFDRLFSMLLKQTICPRQIILMNTQVIPEYSNEEIKKRIQRIIDASFISGEQKIHVQITGVSRDSFDHGGTRAAAALQSTAPYMVYMTQDAVPKDEKLLEKLISALQSEEVVVAYARQEAPLNAGIVEQYTRLFNYPSKSSIKSKEDIDQLGIKTYFCSNVCAAYRRDVYDELGGFVQRTIFNEDMIYAATAIQAGYRIAYVADAVVWHSHQYTIKQQFSRNFDLGVSQRQYKELFRGVPSEKEGMKLVKQTIEYLTGQRYYMESIVFIAETIAKYLGYIAGKNYCYLPKTLCQSISMNQAYWRKDV